MSEPKMARTAVKRCGKYIDKEFNPPRRYVLSRRSCKNKTTHPSGRCHLHRSFGLKGLTL